MFLGGRRKRDSRSCSCSHKEKAGDPRAWSHFSQPVSGRSCSQMSLWPLSVKPKSEKGQAWPRGAPVDAFKVIVLHALGPSGRQRFLPSILSRMLDSGGWVSVRDLGEGPSLCLWAVVRYHPCLVASIPKLSREPAGNPQRPKKVMELNKCSPNIGDIFQFLFLTWFGHLWTGLGTGRDTGEICGMLVVLKKLKNPRGRRKTTHRQ